MLLVSGRVSVPKPLSQIQRSTRWLLQGLSPRTSFGGFGLSRTSPEVIGHTYVLSRELTVLQESVADPLDILADPEGVGLSLANIASQAAALESALDVARAVVLSDSENTPELSGVKDVLDTLIPGVTLLRHLTAGTRSLVAMAEAVESEGFLSREFGSVAGTALAQAQQELTLARKEVASLQALLSIQGIDAEAFLPTQLFGQDAGGSVDTTNRVEALLDDAIGVANFMSSFLGFEEPRTYLLFGQNQNEIRATGGFIGIVVQATVDKGELTEVVFHDSTTVDREPLTDNPIPPDGLFWYLWMGRLLFRDANWSPHFPASAARVAEIYQQGKGIQVDGVITASKLLAFDFVMLFGDIAVPGVEGVLTRRLAEEYTEGRLPYSCQLLHSSIRGKRCFDEDLFFAIKDRLTAGIPSPVRRGFVGLIKEHLDRKNVLLHVFPPLDDSFLWERGWNGAVPFVDHDYLMVVDSSLPGHTTAVVQRSLEYRVSLEFGPDQPIEANLRLRYDNIEEPKQNEICRQYAWAIYHCYWNYFRVYISKRVEASDIQMPPVPLHEGSLKLVWGYPDADSATIVQNADTGPSRLTELGGFIAVEPGSVTTVPIKYLLPSEILRSTGPNVWEYRLLLQKQPGLDQDQISIAVKLPPNAEPLETSPDYNSRRGQWLLFDFTLKRDTLVVVPFEMNERS